MTAAGDPTVRVLGSASEVAEAVLEEVRAVLDAEGEPVVSFATGATFVGFFGRFAELLRRALGKGAGLRATHLDEYLGFRPERRGGMVHEILHACPPVAELAAAGRFAAVPWSGRQDDLAAHERRLREWGGVTLQLLGIGRNGHVAFNEPGTSFDLGFHVARLAPTTRDDARARFAPEDPPEFGVTAGPRDLLEAGRIVLVATGPSKVAAVRAMLRGPIGSSCPASLVRLHPRATVILDREAAAGLEAVAGEDA